MKELKFLKELEASRKEKSIIITHPKKRPRPVTHIEPRDGYAVSKIVKYIQLTDSGEVLCLEEPLPQGAKVEGYLYPLEGGLTQCGIDEKKASRYLEYIGKNYRSEYSKQVEEGSEPTSALASITSGIVFEFRFYDIDLGKKILEKWETFKEELYSPYDPWLAKIYRAYPAPSPKMKYSSHLFLGTNTGVGKSTLASAIGDRVERATPVSLVGGKLEGGLSSGLLNNKDYMVQIEAFELRSNEDKEAINYLLTLLANGEARRWVLGVEIVTKSSSPLIFTFNISALDPLGDFANVVSVFSHNPMAIASRFLLLANNSLMSPKGPEFDTSLVNEALTAARALVRDKVRELYSKKEVRAWLEEYYDEWEAIEERVVNFDWGLEYVKKFIDNYADLGWRKLKALAMARAVSEHLGLIYKGNISVGKIIEQANEYLPEYLGTVSYTHLTLPTN